MATRKTSGDKSKGPTAVPVFDFLAHPPSSLPGIVVSFGDDPFLKRAVRGKVRAVVRGSELETADLALEGDAAEWRTVADELATQSLFGDGLRLVEVTDGDGFITKYRDRLEDYPAKPFTGGVFLLEAKTFPANTRVYKAVAAEGLVIDCRVPTTGRGKNPLPDDAAVIGWMTAWAKTTHRLTLDRKTAAVVYDLVGPQPGLLDQELAKLALYLKEGETATPELAAKVVGGWRTQTAWEMLDHAADGDAAKALALLADLLAAGDAPQAIFGQLTWSLRRFAAAARAFEEAERQGRKISLPQAMEQAGFRKWPADAFTRGQAQLKQIGRDRALRLFTWLKEADLMLKSSHSQGARARYALEALLIKLAKEAKCKPA
jgi:DNA polymerase-3 subunit delta